MEKIFELLKKDFYYFKKHKNNFDNVVRLIKGTNELIKIVGPLLLFTKETAIRKSLAYSVQRSHRDKNRELKINSKRFKIIYGNEEFLKKLAQNELINKSLKEYTSKRGKEITQWTKETIKEKIEIIFKHYGDYVSDLLTFAFFNIYQDSSEVIHGSYYGFLLSCGLEDTTIDSFENSEALFQHITKHETESMKLLFLLMSITIVSIIMILQQEFKLDYDTNKLKKLLDRQATKIQKEKPRL